ncbi:MAG: SRPBCC domain-containing protein [Bacteroidetes bacterium]|nr:SRPBCC domain-containing protein [Bacteroidota bacterium]
MSKVKSPNRVKMELEYPLRSSTNILYQYISSPSGLQSWFADNVQVNQGKFLFKWEDGTETLTEVIKNVTNKYIRFAIVNAPEDEFMEFRVAQDDITGDVELIITEFVNEDEEEMAASIWDSAVDNLRHIIGA